MQLATRLIMYLIKCIVNTLTINLDIFFRLFWQILTFLKDCVPFVLGMGAFNQYYTNNEESSPDVTDIVMPVIVFLRAFFAQIIRVENPPNSLIHSNFVSNHDVGIKVVANIFLQITV